MKTTVKILFLLNACLFVFMSPADSTERNENYWFPNTLNPPSVALYLPSDFSIYSGSAQHSEGNPEFNMYDGVFWADPTTGKEYEHLKKKDLTQLKSPLFWVKLSSSVGQHPGTSNFTNENAIEQTSAMFKLENVKVEKRFWGEYPLLIWTATKPDGSLIHSAWVGLNSPAGWTILIDYRIPINGSKEDNKKYTKIWEDFITKTVPKEPSYDPQLLVEFLSKIAAKLKDDGTSYKLSDFENVWFLQVIKPALKSYYFQEGKSPSIEARWHKSKKTNIIQFLSEKSVKNNQSCAFSIDGQWTECGTID